MTSTLIRTPDFMRLLRQKSSRSSSRRLRHCVDRAGRKAYPFLAADFMKPSGHAPDHRRWLTGKRKDEPVPRSGAKARTAGPASRCALLATGMEALGQAGLSDTRR